MHIWSVMMSLVRHAPAYIKAETNDDACQQLQALADRRMRKPVVLQFEDFDDEIHAYIQRGKRRRMFASIQYEGKE